MSHVNSFGSSVIWWCVGCAAAEDPCRRSIAGQLESGTLPHLQISIHIYRFMYTQKAKYTAGTTHMHMIEIHNSQQALYYLNCYQMNLCPTNVFVKYCGWCWSDDGMCPSLWKKWLPKPFVDPSISDLSVSMETCCTGASRLSSELTHWRKHRLACDTSNHMAVHVQWQALRRWEITVNNSKRSVWCERSRHWTCRGCDKWTLKDNTAILKPAPSFPIFLCRND